MERASLKFILVFGTMVSVNVFFLIDNVKVTAPLVATVGDYVNITCEYSASADNITMKINNKPVNTTKIDKNTLLFKLTSTEKKIFDISCQHPTAMEGVAKIEFGYKADFNYSIERDENRNLWLFMTPNIKRNNEYWNVKCKCSVNKSDWSDCFTNSTNKTTYRFLTENWLYFEINMSSSNKYGSVDKSKTFLKETIPIRLFPLLNISFKSLPSADPFQQYFDVELIHNDYSEWPAYKLMYEIKYWSEFDNSQFGKILFNSTNNFILKLLHPYTTYYVTGRVKKEKNGLWSPYLTKDFKTNTAPSSPPRTTNGSYYLWNCTETGLGRCIILYWEEIPPKLLNGELKGYCVQIIDENDSTDHCQDPKYLTTNSLYKEFQDFPPNKTLTFSIAAVNNDQRKPRATILQVGKKVPKGPKAVYVIRTQENLYNVSWLIHPHQKINNVTVFSCHDKDTSSPPIYCMRDVRWNTVANESYLIVNNSVKQPVFAAYVNTEEGMSSLTKAECIFNPGKPTKPKKPEIATFVNRLTVMWPEFSCDTLNGIPIAYEILYDEGQHCDNGNKLEFKPIGIKPPESSSDIQSLDPGINYSVCIRVVTEKHSSLMSDAVNVVTDVSSVKDDNTPAIVGGFFGALMLILIIAVIIFSIRKCKKEKSAIDIELPGNQDYWEINNSSSSQVNFTKESEDTKEHQNQANGIASSDSYIRAEPVSICNGAFEKNNYTDSPTTTTSFVSSRPTPTSSANDSERDSSGNQEKHYEGMIIPFTENGETQDALSIKQEAAINLTKKDSDIIPNDIELINMPDYVMVENHSESPQTSTNNSNDVLLSSKDSDFLGDSTNNNMPAISTSDPSFPMLQIPNETFEDESENSKSYNNIGYVTAKYTKTAEDSENKVMPKCVSNDNSLPVHQTPTDIAQEENISTKKLNSIEDSKTNCSYDYVLAENVRPIISNTNHLKI